MQQAGFKKEGMLYYLVMPVNEDVKKGYVQRLLQYHDIPYILPCECRTIDGEYSLYFRLQYRTTLKTVLPHLPLNRLQLCNMIKSIVGAFEVMEEYLLNEAGLFWQPDSVFIEADTGKLQFCYAPGVRAPENGLRELLKAVLETVSKKDEENVLLILQFYNLVTEPCCTLDKLKEYVKEKCPDNPAEGMEKEEEPYEDLSFELPGAMENEKETGDQQDSKMLNLTFFLFVIAIIINLIIMLGLLFNILTYDYMPILIVAMGFLVVVTFILFRNGDDESPDEMMQAYFEEDRTNDYFSFGEEEVTNEKVDNVTVFYGETTILTAENSILNESIILEDTPKKLCLRSLEQGKYEPIYIKNSVVLGCMKEGCSYILEERGISRMHAKLMEKADGLYLLDLNSTNGTYLNGEMIESGEDYKIEEGDHISFAKSEFYVAAEA